MVTGALGLLASHRPYLTGSQLRTMLLESARPIPSLSGRVAGGRFLNLGAMAAMEDGPDNCPTDPKKSEPGMCGCNVEEDYSDRNGNGVIDCREHPITSIIPARPTLTPRRGALFVTMTARQGVKYFISVRVNSRGRSRAKTYYYVVSANRVYLKNISPGTSVTVRYAYLIEAQPRIFSYYSRSRRAVAR